MPALSLTALFDYFETMATTIKAVNHIPSAKKKAFCDEDEFLTIKGTHAQYPCIMLEYPEVRPTFNGAENNRDVYQCAISVFVKYETKDLYKSKRAALDTSREILRTITAQMRKDDKTIGSTLARMFDLETIQPLQEVEGKTESIIAYRMTFELNTHLDLSVNSDELID